MAGVVALVITGALVSMAPAEAADPVTCPPGQVLNPTTQTCVISVVVPPGGGGDSGGGAGGGGGGDGGGGQSSPQPEACFDKQRDTKVPCTGPKIETQGTGYWSNGWGCYVYEIKPQPPKSDPIWEGKTGGGIYLCYYPWGAGGLPVAVPRWSATPPAGPAAPPNPQVLAQRAVALMNLRAINIGIVPEDRPGSVGIIGMPTWMWAQNPGATTWGPLTRSASAGGWTVTATAKAQRVDWNMGDGTTVTCTGPGTPYADSYGKKSSPTCGHTYTRAGTYNVRATSYWVITWAGIGQSGTIPLTFSQTATITMGEAQVLTQ